MFQNNAVLRSPIANLMIGIVITAVLQSSSTVTTICVVMVNAKAFTVQQAYYVVMGANVGTAVTSTIIALFTSKERTKFSRAFSAAIIHDLYNWLGVAVLFPIEWISATAFGTGNIQQANLGVRRSNFTTSPLIGHFLLNVDLPDQSIGGILVTLSLVFLITCLILDLLFGGKVRHMLRRSLNFKLKGRWRCLTGYVCILIGLVITSSAVVCTTMIPLVGMDVITLERFWVYEIGADVGTTGTAIVAAFATKTVKTPLQLALCHFMFNVFSIFLFYSIPVVRRLPIRASQALGNICARYRWFALCYIIGTFVLLPAVFLGLNFLSWVAAVTVLVVALVLAAATVTVSVLQRRKPHVLPKFLRTWDFLPEPLRSLEPYDPAPCIIPYDGAPWRLMSNDRCSITA
ncbi:unnamed protein product [Soboliphyme baturini]|uniref:Sodium-dependent phosphate transport protein 2A n=1 Tax=Soboliphyme baturini TaxID=241478 RepID=A0A183IJT0_9BILA|nr:unnamed protein product [Soboliphyme baturini]